MCHQLDIYRSEKRNGKKSSITCNSCGWKKLGTKEEVESFHNCLSCGSSKDLVVLLKESFTLTREDLKNMGYGPLDPLPKSIYDAYEPDISALLHSIKHIEDRIRIGRSKTKRVPREIRFK